VLNYWGAVPIFQTGIMDEQLEFLKEIASRLETAGIHYMVTGSVALAVYAVPRMTRDLDLVIDVQLKDADRLTKLFAQDCYVNREAVRHAARERGMFNIIHNEWILKADFIVRKEEPYRKVEFERRHDIDVGGVPIAVVSPEDLILSKLCWADKSASELHLGDIREIIRSVKDLDWAYMEEWADKIGVRALLEEVRSS